MDDGVLKVRVAAVPEDGKANTELCRYLGGTLWWLLGSDSLKYWDEEGCEKESIFRLNE